MSSSPREIVGALDNVESKLVGKFRHDSENKREKSIILTSSRHEPILTIRKQFLKNCPPNLRNALLNKEIRKFKPKVYLKSHGIRLVRSKQNEVFPENNEALGLLEVLVYPTGGDSRGAVSLSLNDVSRLRPGVYLNDNILDFYLRYMYLEKWDETLRGKVHLFNTFFFKK